MAANLFLNRMRIPFFVCIGILFAAEIAISAVRSQGATTAVTYINVILYLVVALVFSIFFVVTSIRISLFLNKMRKRSTRKASLLKVMSSTTMYYDLMPYTRLRRCWHARRWHKLFSAFLWACSCRHTLPYRFTIA